MKSGELLHKITLTAGVLVTAILMVSVFDFAVARSLNDPERTEIEFKRVGVKLFTEIADTPDKHAKGLMFRTSLGEKEAMIFSFDAPAILKFWMYNTLIPLSIMFLDGSGKIIDIQDMQPCREKNPDMCLVYVSRGLAKYAIETNIGLPQKYGIRTGDRANFKVLR